MSNKESAAPSGLILFHKPPGITSFDALRDIKKTLGTGKVGHTGTLDKFAEGLLLVLAGRALKLSKWFTHCDKQYEATVHFGAETDTLDPEGAVVASAPAPSREAVERVLPQFTGCIEQAPPAYSAIHVDGQRASVLARRGETPEMRKRPVTVHRLELLSWDPPLARIFVHCSSGTYIRALARDIALAAGSRAHLTALVRTRVAGFMKLGMRNEESLLPLTSYLFQTLGIPCIDIAAEDARNMIQGKPLAPMLAQVSPDLLRGEAAAIFSGDRFIAMLEQQTPLNSRPSPLTPHWSYGYVYARD